MISLEEVTIAFQGMEGAYSNMACKEVFQIQIQSPVIHLKQ